MLLRDKDQCVTKGQSAIVTKEQSAMDQCVTKGQSAMDQCVTKGCCLYSQCYGQHRDR